MTPKNETSLEINSIQTFFTDLDKSGTKLAKQLHEAKVIYAVYGLLDGLSLSYSMVKYCFDMMYTNSSRSSSDKLHEWMATPEGMAAAAAESMTIIGFSIIANYFDKKDKSANAFQRYIAVLWPYCRDGLKGMKNAYKGVRSTLQVSSMLSGQSLNHMIVPMGVAIGAIAVLNRMWMRNMRNERKELQTKNSDLLKEIQEKKSLDGEEAKKYLSQIGKQSPGLQERALLSSAYAGVVDGLYLYMGAMSFAVLSPPVFVAMSLFCVMFTFACIATRIYEESDYQRKLRATAVDVELAICGKQLDGLFFRLQALSLRRSGGALSPELKRLFPELEGLSPKEIEAEQTRVIDAFDKTLEEFVKKRCELVSLNTVSHTSATLAGMQNGLAAYSAIMSSVYAVATVGAMLSIPLPPAFLVGAILAGMASLIAFALHSYYKNAPVAEAMTEAKPANLGELLKAVKNGREVVKVLDSEMYKSAMDEGLRLGETPQHFTQEWLEVVRSLFSGVAKGQKTVEYTLSSWQEPDERTPLMSVISFMSWCVFALGLSLRALARGLKDKNNAAPNHHVDDESPAQEAANEPEPSHFTDALSVSSNSRPKETASGTSTLSIQEGSVDETPKRRRAYSPRLLNEGSPIEKVPPTARRSSLPPSFFRSKSTGDLQEETVSQSSPNSVGITPGLA